MSRRLSVDEFWERFWSKVDRRGDHECWRWLGRLNWCGYGTVKSTLAHRYAWMYSNRALIPTGRVIMHTCDNPACVNPAHLKLATQGENVRDMFRKGRNRSSKPVGESNGFAKLSDSSITQILLGYMEGATMAELAQRFGVDPANIGCVIKGRTWRHIPRPEGFEARARAVKKTNKRRACARASAVRLGLAS